MSFYSTLSNGNELASAVRSIVPALSHNLYKGNCGRIGVIGGCKEYTGAPYFAAISALKVGADLAHVICAEEAAPIIKSYSPELIVHPILGKPNSLDELGQWLAKLHVLVIGPGLGRDTQHTSYVREAMMMAKDLNLPLVVDADGIFVICTFPDVILNYSAAVLTPNWVEFGRLYKAMCKTDASSPSDAVALAKLMGVTVILKGREDFITDGSHQVICQNLGSARRCGGQGDLLSGSLGTFIHWAYQAQKSNTSNEGLKELGPNIVAAYAATFLTRECNSAAFRKHKRATTTTDMIECISHVFQENFEVSHSE